ncbi:phosphoribosylaminoimidazole carboxylase ATPase subunit [compost metagenome]
MVNLVGEKGYEGTPVYEGIEDILATKGAFVHLYGKSKTKSFRKMGHITIVGDNAAEVKEKAGTILDTIKVKA